MSATELAGMLQLSKGRISQLVSAGTLDGCYSGSGRQRRFDPDAVARALGTRLDPGQRLGNGAKTQQAIRDMDAERPAPAPVRDVIPAAESEYEAARTAKVLAEARRAQRLNAEAEGTFVLADEVARQVRRQIGQEIAEVQTFIRGAARRLADLHGLDFKLVRQTLMDDWRAHRGQRAETAETVASVASVAELSEAEEQADI